MRRLGVILALAAALLPAFLATGAAAPQVNITDLEDEVMCPICGTLLELTQAPQAERERAFIRGLIAGGESKDEIKDALVREYGEGVLALPRGSGFQLSAYLVPAIALAIAVLALALGVRRWQRNARRAGPGDGDAPRPGPEGEDAERLEADIARYDL